MQELLDTEWLVTNGLGGYSSCSMAGVITRRYHGLLVAALPNPLGRMVMLNHLGECISANGSSVPLNGEDRVAGRIDSALAERVASVRIEAGLPVWEYEWNGVRIEKRILMPHQQNTVHVTYRLLSGPSTVMLELVPAVHFRGYEDPVNVGTNLPAAAVYSMSVAGGVHMLGSESPLPPLRLKIDGKRDHRFIADERTTSELLYPVEAARGYEFRGLLWVPGRFEITMDLGECVTLIASVEDEDVMLALSADDAAQCELERRRRLVSSAVPQAQDSIGAELVLAADQFIIKPAGRVADATRAAAMGNEIRTVIAGYHWFTDWGRDTMISLEGLTLTTGRHREAGFILRTFAQYVRAGLIPNLFPDGSDEGLYHTADATLWFFHALDRYAQATEYWALVEEVLPKMRGIVDAHLQGTRFGIGVDPADGLLRQGADGYQLTWMDAKVDDWVVTPRRGKAVEINALWYNALCLLSRWECDLGDAGRSNTYSERAARVRESFNSRFWYEQGGHLYDVLDGPGGNDAACRPNQIFAISLPNPVLDESRWGSVMKVVQEKLLTPVGLRSLSPDHPDYKKKYFGDLRTRDAAYHQGTVWAWLIGPWIDAWLKVHPDDKAGARRFLDGLIAHLPDFGVGSVAEIFDAEPPYTPRGCIAQAWSVAEVLRCWVKTS